MYHKIIYKTLLESSMLVGILAGVSFCAELFLPGVISLSQKTLSILTLLIIMVITARYMSLTYPVHTTAVKSKNSSPNSALLWIGLVAIAPLYIATKNFSPFLQAMMIILTLIVGYLLFKELRHSDKNDQL